MPIGDNKPGENKLISKTTRTRKADTTGDTSKASKTREPTPYTKKVTFYLAPDNAEKIKNFAYWDRHTETEAVNIIIEDGLKGKTTKPIPKGRR